MCSRGRSSFAGSSIVEIVIQDSKRREACRSRITNALESRRQFPSLQYRIQICVVHDRTSVSSFNTNLVISVLDDDFMIHKLLERS